MSWIAIGDSITYLNEHKEETGYRIEKGYMTRVVEKLLNITYTNQGHNGWTSEKIAANLEKLGLEKAGVYSIFLGTNDWWQGRKVVTMTDYQNDTGNTLLCGSIWAISMREALRQANTDNRIALTKKLSLTSTKKAA